MRFTKSAVIAAIIGVGMLASTTAQAQMCADARAREALEMRVLQSELMVAALTCNQRPSYNAFVTTFKPYLKDQGRALKGFFTQAYGDGTGAKRLNGLVTRLANVASKNSLTTPTSEYCARAQERFDAVLGATPRALAKMARANAASDAHGVPSCLEMAGGEASAQVQR